MLTGQMPWLLTTVGNAGFQLVLLVLVNAHGSRWSTAAVWHASVNAVGGSFFFTMVTGPDQQRLFAIMAVSYALLAVAVAVVVRRRSHPGVPATNPETVPALPDRAGAPR